MIIDVDFKNRILKGYGLATVEIVYFLPDYQNLIQSFIWQTLDKSPDFNRIHKFIHYWNNHIEANIKEIYLSYDDQIKKSNFQYINSEFKIQ